MFHSSRKTLGVGSLLVFDKTSSEMRGCAILVYCAVLRYSKGMVYYTRNVHSVYFACRFAVKFTGKFVQCEDSIQVLTGAGRVYSRIIQHTCDKTPHPSGMNLRADFLYNGDTTGEDAEL